MSTEPLPGVFKPPLLKVAVPVAGLVQNATCQVITSNHYLRPRDKETINAIKFTINVTTECNIYALLHGML